MFLFPCALEPHSLTPNSSPVLGTMPRFKSGVGPTGKNGKKKKVNEAAEVSEQCIDEKEAKSHKKQPKPYEQWKRERQERIAAWLSSEEGQRRPGEQDQCDCPLGEKTRHEAHDLFCPVFCCFAFEIGCCAWETNESQRYGGKFVGPRYVDGRLRYSMSP